MKNLALQAERRRNALLPSSDRFDAKSTAQIVDICHLDHLGNDESLTALLTSDGILMLLRDNGQTSWSCNLNQTCDESLPNDEWFNVTNVDPNLVCLSKNGAIVTVSPETGYAELVGEFEYGIETASWSPDREVLLLVTFTEEEDENSDEAKKKSVLLSMNSQWEVLAEVDMEDHVSFQDSGISSKLSACWRPDGTLCVVSSVDASDSIRKVRFYKRETLDLHAIGRTEDASGKLVPNLQDADIAWAGPACSQLMAAIQRKGKKTQQVAFFEPNGLRHREFVLREDPAAKVLGLCWNVESDLLAVTIRGASCDKVQLWHRSNYHWYLAREFRYSGEQNVTLAKFHEERPYTLFVILSGVGLHWREYEVRWDASSVDVRNKDCTAFVIDGCNLNMTPLAKALVPPPMYASSLTMERAVNEVAFVNDKSTQVFGIAFLSDGSLVILNREKLGTSIVVKWHDEMDMDLTLLRNFLVVKTDPFNLRLLAVSASPFGNECESIKEISISWKNGQEAEASLTNSISLEDRVLRMVSWSDAVTGALIELVDGQLLEYEITDDEDTFNLIPSEADPLLEPCPWLAALKEMSCFEDSGEYSDYHRRRLVVGLSSHSRLYCHDMLLADSASSFILSTAHQYVCYVSAGSISELKFLPLKQLCNFDPLMGSDQNNFLMGYEPRSVERGTRLVAVIPHQPTSVLQMPRGNLEGVYPRALVLRYSMVKITNGEYKEAFKLMRRQKVDLNLIVDMDPFEFIEGEGRDGVCSFVEQVEAIDYLNLFISCLQNWDSTQQRYRIPEWFRKNTDDNETNTKKEFDFTTKVNSVCRKMRSIMLKAEECGKTAGGRKISEGHFLLPILSTFAKEDPPRLEDALLLIKENAFAEHISTPSKKSALFSDSAQSAIQYLAFLADYEQLFETALGLYDYEIARAVARNSQMDPRVYLPLLKRYRGLPVYFGRYEVDLRLKRYESALRNLFESGFIKKESLALNSALALNSQVDPKEGTAFNEVALMNSFDHCMNLIEKHSLHRVGLELFHSEDNRRMIMLSLGNHLIKQKLPETALNVFLAMKPVDLECARQAARDCRDWKTFFSLSMKENQSLDNFDDNSKYSLQMTARKVADELAMTSQGHANRRAILGDAARVLFDYGKDFSGSVDMLIRAEMWTEGQRIGLLCGREDLVHKCIEGAISHAHISIADLEERRETFLTANARYVDVLKIRKDAAAGGEGEGGMNFNDIDDNGSLFSAATNASNLSIQSASSTGSSGSTASLSSVISVKTSTSSSFTLSGAEEAYRHKSKYNQIGKNKKKKRKKKKKGKSSKARPGSIEELQSIVERLRSGCVDEETCKIISETISFLCRVGEMDLGRGLYDAYCCTSQAIHKSQQDRIEAAREEKLHEEKQARREGIDHYEPVTLACEKEVDSMRCAVLPSMLVELFSLLPPP